MMSSVEVAARIEAIKAAYEEGLSYGALSDTIGEVLQEVASARDPSLRVEAARVFADMAFKAGFADVAVAIQGAGMDEKPSEPGHQYCPRLFALSGKQDVIPDFHPAANNSFDKKI
ncbi:MAG TPA: hypothetical protein VJB02_04955 [Coxiellaceae bacterium]|nr:hypothetical protein [Coxiellaceae bacterium]